MRVVCAIFRQNGSLSWAWHLATKIGCHGFFFSLRGMRVRGWGDMEGWTHRPSPEPRTWKMRLHPALAPDTARLGTKDRMDGKVDGLMEGKGRVNES